ncbi:MAG: AlwI family type II restriction endonuclease [Candidatus Aminicenantes bacterium]|nr:AlwI family type II restriction endonuclease [Candidatus Aminicenantes bacterium]
MPKIKIDWNKFIKEYLKNDAHWYVSKIKEYTEKEYDNLRVGLLLLEIYFIDESSSERKALESFVIDPQQNLPGMDVHKIISKQWNFQTQLYYTSRLDEEELVSELNRARHDKRELYTKIRKDIKNELNFHSLLKKYSHTDLNDYAANGRNFVSFFKKLGFAWIETDRSITISDAGYKFIDSSNLQDLLETQRIKLQLWNPSLPIKRYGRMNILPYFFLLKLLIKLKDLGFSPHLTKHEYSLFVTKATQMDELEKVFNYIIAFRNLKKNNQQKIIRTLKSKKRKRNGASRRSLWDEIIDSAGKEIGFFTSNGICKAVPIGKAEGIVLDDEKKARALVQRLEKNISYITFNNEEEWFQYYGDTNVKPILKDVLKYYSESGKYALVQKTVKTMIEQDIEITEEIKKIQEKIIYEKEIEDFYEKNISIIQPDLKLLKKGRQFPTEIGNIDLLTQDKNGRYFVIELKRDQADDDTIGQVLRYMGWVHINLAKQALVTGVILSQDITNKLKYARIGTQHPDIDEVLLFKKYPPQVLKIIQTIKEKIGSEEFDYSVK